MLAWVIPLIWAFMRALSYAMTLVSTIALFYIAGRGLLCWTESIIDKEDARYEDQD